MPTATVEDYLKRLFLLEQKTEGRLAPMGRLAEVMQVTPGTATSMVKVLHDSGLVDYEPRQGVCLTNRGRQLALTVVRRHRLIEQFLVEVLRLDWSEVDVEAETLEHAVSDKVLEKMDELLGHPQVDPHGDPIPNAQGKLPAQRLCNLCECALHQKLRITRVMDQDPAFLQFIDRHNLKPGAEITITAKDESADALTIDADDQTPVTLGSAAAAKILVESASPCPTTGMAKTP